MKIKFSNNVLLWVWRDNLLRYRKEYIKNIVLDVFVVATQVVAYAILFNYARALEKEQTIDFLGISIDPRNSLEALLAVAAGAGTIFLISGLLQYYTQLYALSIARRYEIFCSQRLLDKLNKSKQPHLLFYPGEYQIELRAFRKSLIKDTRFCGKTALLISKSVLAFLKLIVSMIVMFKIHFMISMIIVGLGIPAMFLLKRSGKKVIEMTKLKEQLLTSFIKTKRDILGGILRKDSEVNDDQPIKNQYDQKKIKSYYDAYYGIYRSAEQNRLISQVFIAVFTVSILLLAGNLVLSGYMTWAIFIAYILVLKFFFNSFSSFANIIRKASKFYDYIAHYISLLQSIDKKSEASLNELGQASQDSNESEQFLSLLLDDGDDDDDDDDDF